VTLDGPDIGLAPSPAVLAIARTPWPPGGLGYDSHVVPAVIAHLVADDGTCALRVAIADPDRLACKPKVDGVRGWLLG